MTNEDKMLQLVLSDEKLSSFYEFDPAEFSSMEDALSSENPIIVTVAKIIQGVGGNSDKGTYKEIYIELINYLNQNIL